MSSVTHITEFDEQITAANWRQILAGKVDEYLLGNESYRVVAGFEAAALAAGAKPSEICEIWLKAKGGEVHAV